ncbi:MAG TPA: hypothetical protein VNO21_14540, partial [Polyangiaceae bacterium]|nr:hypothetical protein [Polyangiaceae bacterium]
KVTDAASFDATAKGTCYFRAIRGVNFMRLACIFASFAVSATSVMACSASQDPPVRGTFTVNFSSVKAAVATDTLLVFAFDTGGDANLCGTLVGSRQSKANWPKNPLTSGTFATCNVLTGQGGSLGAVDFGDRAIVVVGQSKGSDLFIGCEPTTIGNGDVSVAVSLMPIDPSGVSPDSINATKCTTVADHCAGNC